MGTNAIYVLVGVLGFVLILATAAGAYFAFRTSRNTGLVEVYKGTADAWQERAGAYAVQIKELQEQNKMQASQIADLTGQITMLKELVTGQQAITSLISKVDGIHRMMEEHVA